MPNLVQVYRYHKASPSSNLPSDDIENQDPCESTKRRTINEQGDPLAQPLPICPDSAKMELAPGTGIWTDKTGLATDNMHDAKGQFHATDKQNSDIFDR